MHEQAHSLRENEGTINRLRAKGVGFIKQRLWSVLPGRLPHLDGRVIPGYASNIDALLESVGGVNASGSSRAVVWTPPGAGRVKRSSPGGTFSGLRWGYTVHILDGRLVAFQRVIFIDGKARRLSGDPSGDFRVVTSYFVSSWSDLETKLGLALN